MISRLFPRYIAAIALVIGFPASAWAVGTDLDEASLVTEVVEQEEQTGISIPEASSALFGTFGLIMLLRRRR